MITMSTNEIKAFKPCATGWKRLLTGLNKTEADDEQIPFIKFLETNTLDEVFWAMRVKWFEHKEAFMNVVNAAADRAAAAAHAADRADRADAAAHAADRAYAAVYAAHAAETAYAAAYAAAHATDRAYAADRAAETAYAAADAAEREQQKQDIIKFCS